MDEKNKQHHLSVSLLTLRLWVSPDTAVGEVKFSPSNSSSMMMVVLLVLKLTELKVAAVMLYTPGVVNTWVMLRLLQESKTNPSEMDQL